MDGNRNTMVKVAGEEGMASLYSVCQIEAVAKFKRASRNRTHTAG